MHLHALSDAGSQEVQALLDPANESNTIMSGDNPQTSAPVNTTHTTLANSSLGARAEDDAAGALEGQIGGQGEDREQSRTAGGGAGQHTTGTRQSPWAMSSDDINAWIRARKSSKYRALELPRYKAGQGWAKVTDRT